MEIQYIYRIVNVDESTKTMEIKYDSPQFGTLHVSARMPDIGETLENVVRQYEPIEFWKEQIKEVEPVEVDTYGSIQYNTELTIEEIEANVRALRNQLLLDSDFTQLLDAPNWVVKEDWKVYRQLLREIPDQEGFPTNVVWPVSPSITIQ